MTFHEMCIEATRWANNCPEATVGGWILSGILMIVNMALVIRRMFKSAAVQEVISPITVPYVPSETVLKLLKLLNEQDSGWAMGYGFDLNNPVLHYSNLSFSKWADTVTVCHKNTTISLANNSQEPELDQGLLLEAFNKRLRKEKAKVQAKQQIASQEAEKVANRELANILDTI